jgi:hypothetical protein
MIATKFQLVAARDVDVGSVKRPIPSSGVSGTVDVSERWESVGENR